MDHFVGNHDYKVLYLQFENFRCFIFYMIEIVWYFLLFIMIRTKFNLSFLRKVGRSDAFGQSPICFVGDLL